MTLPAGTPFLTDPAAQRVCAMLEDAGHAIYFVGGCVRNAIMGLDQSDIDMSTDAHPETVMTLAKAAGLKCVPTGIDHGTVTVVSDSQPFEITTFRRDVETDGRRAVVAFSDNIEEDALRRDFTMNALYARPNGDIVDPVGGLPDALARRVVFIQDARARIREDYLRVLRFFRFWAHYADPSEGMEPDALAAIADTLDGLETLSAERVGAEMLKLLAAPDPSMALATMDQIGVLARLLPVQDVNPLPRLVHLETETATAPDAIRRLAVIGPIEAPQRLRLSKKQARALEDLRDAAGQSWGPRALGFLYGAARGWDAALVRAASLEAQISGSLRQDVDLGAAAEFPVQASDIMPKFQGPALGAELTRLRAEWLKSDLALEKDALLG